MLYSTTKIFSNEDKIWDAKKNDELFNFLQILRAELNSCFSSLEIELKILDDLEMVIRELTSNAIDSILLKQNANLFCGVIKIDCRLSKKFFRFIVEDNGCGIFKEHSNLEEMSHDSNKIEYKEKLKLIGFRGLGLVSVTKICRKLNASIECRNKGINNGAIFQISLPLN